MLFRPDRSSPLFTPRFIRLWLFSFLTFFSAFQLFPTIPFRILDLGGSKMQAGAFLAVYTWTSAISAPIMGAFADHLGRKRLLLTAAVSFFFFSLAYGVVTWFPLLLVIASIHGMLWSALLASSGALITDVIPITRRTEGLAYWGLAPTAAIALAPPVGLFLYRYDWMVLCGGMAVLSIGITILGIRVREDRRPTSPSPPSIRNVIHWRVMLSGLTLFVVAFGYGGITSYVAVMAEERAIHPASLFFTATAITIIIARILIAPAGDRMGPARLLVPSLVVVPFALGTLAIADSRTMIVIAAILFGLGVGGAYPGFLTWVLSRTRPERTAATFGSVLFAMDTGIGTGSIATGALAEAAGFKAAFFAAAVLSLLAIPFFLASRRILPELE